MMKIELESKFRVSKETAQRIKDFFAKRVLSLDDGLEEEKQINYYFYPAGEDVDIFATTIRLRVSPSGAVLTLKSRVGKKKADRASSARSKRYKKRREEEHEVPGNLVLKALRALGAKEESYEKLRTHCLADFHWARPKDALRHLGSFVDIDFVPELDRWFVEIEAESTRIINRLVKELGLSWDDLEPKSYIQLIREARLRGRP